jgi:hypothetical protein
MQPPRGAAAGSNEAWCPSPSVACETIQYGIQHSASFLAVYDSQGFKPDAFVGLAVVVERKELGAAESLHTWQVSMVVAGDVHTRA